MIGWIRGWKNFRGNSSKWDGGERRGSRRSRLADQLVAWFLLIALVPLGVSVTLAYRVSADALRDEILRGLSAIASRQASQIDSLWNGRVRDVTALAFSPTVVAAMTRVASAGNEGTTEGATRDEALKQYLGTHADSFGYDDIYLVNPKGDVTFSLKRGSDYGTNLKTGPYRESQLARVVDRAGTLLDADISDYAFYPATAAPAAFLAAPIVTDGSVLGVLAVSASSRQTFDVVNDYTGLGETGETIVASRLEKAAVLVAPIRSDPGAALNRTISLARNTPSESTPIAQAVMGHRGAGATIDYRGVPVLADWRYIPTVRWGMVVKMDSREALAGVERLKVAAYVVAALTALGVTFAARAVARTISQPVARLTASARLIAWGDLEQPVAPGPRNEIGELARRFSEMTASLREGRKRLEEANVGLERRVEERTAELTSTNTELESALEQLERTKDRLVVQEKMASLGNLTAGVAHEIKNPLNFVNNFAELSAELAQELAELLAKNPLPDDDLEEARAIVSDLGQNVEKINEHGKRADSIVKGMLQHSRGGTKESESFDLNALLKEAVQLAYHGLRARDQEFNVTLDVQLDPGVGMVVAVPQDLNRVFLNVVNNACYAADMKRRELGLSASGAGGTRAPGSFVPTVVVRTRPLARDRVEITVTDNGTGISEANTAKVFEPFFTTKPTGQGTGLGLSLSFDIVNSHGGELTVESEEGEFTEFRILLPRKPVVETPMGMTTMAFRRRKQEDRAATEIPGDRDGDNESLSRPGSS